jgi:NADPH-dependent glutamate synthase beta subunit-like oxidoreductase
VEIGKIQRALVEHGWKIGFQPFTKPVKNRQRIAVVGSGPSGLSCAAELARDGFAVTVFEERAEPGGVIRYGVPAYRFDKSFLFHEIADLMQLGVEFVCGTRINGNEGVRRLLKEGYKAVFLGPGLWAAQRIPGGEKVKGVHTSVEFLSLMREERFGEVARDVEGKVVAVIGGGSVAMDCVESAAKLGARDAYLVYRRSFAQMPAEEEERLAALRLGVHFLMLNQPVGYSTDEKGRLAGLKLLRCRLGELDSSGRRKAETVQGSEWILAAQFAVEAIGNRPDAADWSGLVKTDAAGLVVTEETTRKTSAESVFAGGDITRGAGLVVEAVQDGKRAARTIRAAMV